MAVGFILGFQKTLGLPPRDEGELRLLTLEQLQALKDDVIRTAHEQVSSQAKAGDEATPKKGTD